jgi:hypothetical protein
LKWFKLTAEINPILKWFRQSELILRFMLWEEDYVLPSVRKVVESHYKSSKLFVVANCGTCGYVEQCFNEAVLSFMSGTK